MSACTRRRVVLYTLPQQDRDHARPFVTNSLKKLQADLTQVLPENRVLLEDNRHVLRLMADVDDMDVAMLLIQGTDIRNIDIRLPNESVRDRMIRTFTG